MGLSRNARAERLLRGALIFLVFLAAADGGNALRLIIAPTLIWPAAGIAFACAVLYGLDAVIAVFFGELVFLYSLGTYSFTLVLALAAITALQAAAAARVLTALSFHTGFSRLRDAYLFAGVVLIAAAIVPSLGVATLLAAHRLTLETMRAAWGNWYVGELFSVLALGAFILRWLPKPFFHRTKNEWVEIALVLAVELLLSFFIFATPYGEVGGVPLLYLLLLPLFWSGLRLGPRIMTLELFLLAFAAVAGSIVRFSPADLPQSLFSIELLISVLALIFILTTAVAEERKDATALLRRQLLRLEVALEKIRDEDKAKSEFIAVLAHELRNPLAPLLSSLELMRLTEASAKTRSAINAMRGRVRTMGRLLDDLLDFSRIEHRTLSLSLERADLVRIAGRAVETMEPLWGKKRQHFLAELPRAPLEIDADPVRVEQIIVNLLTNAQKYTPEEGRVALTLAHEDREAVLNVADTGAGIRPEALSGIFEPFAQGEPGRRVGGLGIGLALSKSLTLMHGGSLTAASEGPNRGSTFTLRLPLAEESRVLPRIEKKRELKRLAPASPLSLLIIDDNRAAADTLAALLAHLGHEVSTAYDGASGLRKAAQGKPAAIILDIGLPDFSGYEVAERLRSAGSASVLIALTGFGQAEDREKALAAGFAYHLVKPVGLADLEPVLRAIAKKKKKRTS